MPSDKIVLCTPSFITPDANSTTREAAGLFLCPPTAPKKGKRRLKKNLQSPSINVKSDGATLFVFS